MDVCFFVQAEDGIRDLVRSRGLGDVYKRQILNKGQVGFGDHPLVKHPVHAPERFGSLGKKTESAHRAVQPVGYANKYISGLCVPFFKKLLEGFAQRGISRDISLNNFSHPFIDHYKMVILVEDAGDQVRQDCI